MIFVFCGFDCCWHDHNHDHNHDNDRGCGRAHYRSACRSRDRRLRRRSLDLWGDSGHLFVCGGDYVSWGARNWTMAQGEADNHPLDRVCAGSMWKGRGVRVGGRGDPVAHFQLRVAAGSIGSLRHRASRSGVPHTWLATSMPGHQQRNVCRSMVE